MKVDNSLPPPSGSRIKGGGGRTAAAGEKDATAKTSTTPQDSVQLSKLPSNAENVGAPIDTARVEAIKQAISEGRFKINPEAIADGLISTAKDLMVEHSA